MAGGVTRGEQLAGYVGFRVSQVLPAREMWVASCYRTAIDFYNILMIVKNSIGDRGSLPKGSNPEKKAASFWTLSKSGLYPPPLVLDTLEVTFV